MLKAPHDADAMHDRLYIQKPLGFSYFPNEIIPAPKAWVSTTGNLVFWRQHDKVRLNIKGLLVICYRVGISPHLKDPTT